MKKSGLFLVLSLASSFALGKPLDCREIGNSREAAVAYLETSTVRDVEILAQRCDGQAQLLNILSQQENDVTKKQELRNGVHSALDAYSTFYSLK